MVVKATGASYPAVSDRIVKESKIPLPPLAEQRRIAAILDKADELRTKRREALAHLDTLTQSIFHSMFSGNKDLQTLLPLAEAVAPGTAVTYGIVQAGEEFPGGVPYIRTGDLTGGVIAAEKLRRTDPKIAAKFARSRVSAGDIVMSIRATVGTVAITPEGLEGANLTQGTARIAPGPNLTSEYLLEFLRAEATQRWIWRNVKGATFKEITLERLRTLPVAIPPLSIQRSFSNRVAAVERLKELHLKHLAELDALFASLQQRAFKGEL
jgi:type I restriction enzyme S subunit